MPEGDVVWRTARQLHAALAGWALTRSDFRVPRFATTDLTGRAVQEVASRGKHILARVDGGVTIHTHLRMDGSWRIRPAGGYPRGVPGHRGPGVSPGAAQRPSGPAPRDHRVRLVLANERWQAIGYLLGVVEVLPTAREDTAVGHLGPDLLGPDWDSEEAARRLLADPGRAIGEALLDQRNLAGIGTWFLAEMLFLRGIEPGRPAGSIDDMHALVELGHRLLDANKARVGHTSTGNTRRGQESWVYGRAGQPCRRCGTVIRRGEQGPSGQERLRFWCPSCQV